MKRWTWLLPCWVWKYAFAQLPREKVRLDGRTRFLIRLDQEFALVYDPHATETWLKPTNQKYETTIQKPESANKRESRGIGIATQTASAHA